MWFDDSLATLAGDNYLSAQRSAAQQTPPYVSRLPSEASAQAGEPHPECPGAGQGLVWGSRSRVSTETGPGTHLPGNCRVTESQG